MNDRERILTLLGGRQPDRVPWFGDLAYWAYARMMQGKEPMDFFNSAAYYDWHRRLGVGFYLQGYEPYRAHYEGMEVRTWEDGHARYREAITPRGRLREMWQYLPASYTYGPTELFVKSVDDLPAFHYFLEHTRFEPDYAEALRRREMVNDVGLVMGYTPKSPLMQLVVLYAGIEAVVDLLMQDPAALRETVRLIAQCFEPALQIALASPVDCLMIPENLSSEVIGKALFEEYLRPYQEAWVRRISQAAKYSFIHMDGTLRGLLTEEASVGFTVLEALTPQPVGDLAVEQWEAMVGDDRTILWGGLPGSYFTAHVSEEEFEHHVRKVLEVMRQRPRFVLGVADQVPPDVIERRVKRVVELVEMYGRY